MQSYKGFFISGEARIYLENGVNPLKSLPVSLASRYPEKRLYRLLVKAEHEAGLRGRPEAIDHVGEISDLLQELARKSGERT
jgi:hypothetical protein